MISKKYSHAKAAALLLSGLLLTCTLDSCHKTEYAPSANLPTLRQYIAQDSTLSLMQLALQRAGLDTLLASGGPFTMFAPVNSAFLSAGLSADSIAAYDPAALRNLVGYSLVTGRIGSATLQGFVTDSAVSAASSFEPLITENYYGLFIDGIIVTQGNIALADGILHKTGRVAIPPNGSLLHMLDSLPNTTMADYIFNRSVGLRALAANPDPLFAAASYLEQLPYGQIPQLPEGQIMPSSYCCVVTGTLTLLIPTDSAFRQYGFNSPADLAALDSVTRTNLIVSGIMFGSYFTSDFMGGQIAGQLHGIGTEFKTRNNLSEIALLITNGLLTYDSTNGAETYVITNNQNTNDLDYEIGIDGLTLLGSGVVTPPRIVTSNLVTSGGVIHLINQVFVPTGTYGPQYVPH